MGIPESAHGIGEWIAGGGLSLAILIFGSKYFWHQLEKANKKQEKDAEEREKSTKAAIIQLNKAAEEMDKAYQILLSKMNTLEIKFQEHANMVMERRRVLDERIKELEAVQNKILVAKAKEIAEFDTKIQDLQRRAQKLEDQVMESLTKKRGR